MKTAFVIAHQLKVIALTRIAEYSSIQVDDLLPFLQGELLRLEEHGTPLTAFPIGRDQDSELNHLQRRAVEILLDIYERNGRILFTRSDDSINISSDSILSKPSAYAVAIHPRGTIFLASGKNPKSQYDVGTKPRQKSQPIITEQRLETLIYLKEKALKEPKSESDASKKIIEAIAGRRGQYEFRRMLLNTYKRCLVTGCEAEEVLEAAHIQPYCQEGTFNLSNGLLLRADIHTLFDLGLLAVDSKTMTIVIASNLKDTNYRSLVARKLLLSQEHQNIPDRKALDTHRREVFDKQI